MSMVMVDEQTGLELPVPPGWRAVTTPLFAAVMVMKSDHRFDGFAPNAVATVVALDADVNIVDFTRSTTEAWRSATIGGWPVSIGTWPHAGFEGREVIASYVEAERGVVVATYLLVTDGLGVRLDVSFGTWDAPEAVEVARWIASGLRTPTSPTPLIEGREVALLSLLESVRDA